MDWYNRERSVNIVAMLVLAISISSCNANRLAPCRYYDVLFVDNEVVRKFQSLSTSCDKVGFLDSLYKGYFFVEDYYGDFFQYCQSIDLINDVEIDAGARLFWIDGYARRVIKSELESISGYKMMSLPYEDQNATDLSSLEKDIVELYSIFDCIERVALPRVEEEEDD